MTVAKFFALVRRFGVALRRFRMGKKARFPTLSQRQKEVADCLTRGAGNKEIAAELGISVSMVKHHLKRAYRKMGFKSRAQLAVFYSMWRIGRIR